MIQKLVPSAQSETVRTFAVHVEDEKRAKDFANEYGQHLHVAFVTVTRIIHILQSDLHIPVIESGIDSFTIDLSRIPAGERETAERAWERAVQQYFAPKKTGFRLVETETKKA